MFVSDVSEFKFVSKVKPAFFIANEEVVVESGKHPKLNLSVYRNWMNSLGVDPYVNYLYTDLYDGLIFFQIYEIIQPGIVDWKQVIKRNQLSKLIPKARLQILQNCEYAVKAWQEVKLHLGWNRRQRHHDWKQNFDIGFGLAIDEKVHFVPADEVEPRWKAD